MPIDTENIENLHNLLLNEFKENSSLTSRLAIEICKRMEFESKIKQLEYSLKSANMTIKSLENKQ